MLFPVQGAHILETAYYLPVFLIKNSYNEGCSSHFASFLDWSKNLHSFVFTKIATSDKS